MKVISLFSGAGGFDLGLVQAGHKIVWANDIDHDAVCTYRANIGSEIICADIAKVSIDTIADGEVVVGGFPCQGFSVANLRRSIDDPRNTLYRYFLRIVQHKSPKYFLAENVRGLLSLESGNVIKAILADFEKSGYRVKYKLFNLANYGVPQSRQRVIIAGTRNDLEKHLDFCFPSQTHSNGINGTSLKKWVTISSALAGVPEPDGRETLLNHIVSRYKITNRNFTGHRHTDPDKPSPTILARGNGKGGVCAIQHPNNHRRLSVRESAIIQTFPNTFTFVGGMNSCYRQVGNAVPVHFAYLLGIQLRLLEEENL